MYVIEAGKKPVKVETDFWKLVKKAVKDGQTNVSFKQVL